MIYIIIFLLVEAVLITAAAESGQLLYLILSIISAIAVLNWFFDVSVLSIISANILMIVPLLFAYVLVGTAYVLLWRWPEFLREHSAEIANDYESYKKNHALATLDDFMQSSYYAPYKAKTNKEYLTSWALAWPLSLLWEVAHKPTLWLWDNTYALLNTTFEKVGSRTTKNILKK
jgi:hypothetical protein